MEGLNICLVQNSSDTKSGLGTYNLNTNNKQQRTTKNALRKYSHVEDQQDSTISNLSSNTQPKSPGNTNKEINNTGNLHKKICQLEQYDVISRSTKTNERIDRV